MGLATSNCDGSVTVQYDGTPGQTLNKQGLGGVNLLEFGNSIDLRAWIVVGFASCSIRVYSTDEDICSYSTNIENNRKVIGFDNFQGNCDLSLVGGVEIALSMQPNTILHLEPLRITNTSSFSTASTPVQTASPIPTNLLMRTHTWLALVVCILASCGVLCAVISTVTRLKQGASKKGENLVV